MTIFDVLTLIGGLCLFLFGMNVMGDALERRAGGSLKKLLAKLTQNKIAGFLTGLGVTAVIQSSSATTVMVVGFVNSGIMSLKQSIGVIMGANIGTTVTAWILSLGGISSDNMFIQLLKPTSFTPLLALIGTALLMFGKSSKKKDTGTILLGFATLMFGMDTMSSAVSGLADVPAFQNLFIMFKNPILGVLAGAILTAIIQSSSASVGILQALSATGQVSYGAAVPIIMGQNIGTCVTALLSSFGTNKNAKRVAVLEEVADSTNIGALFRSAAALNIDAVLITPTCCDPLCRRAVRVSMGTVFQIPWTFLPENWLAVLKENGFQTAAMALSDDSISIDDPCLPGIEKLAIVLGTEGDGLAQTTVAQCDYTVRIPMSHGVDSLNVAAASAVAFWQLSIKE